MSFVPPLGRLASRSGRSASALAAGLAAAALLAPAPLAAETLEEILVRHVAARGGLEALRAVHTVRMTGQATAGPGRHAIIRREIARPGRIRTEFAFQGTTGVYVWDGSVGWRVSPLDGHLDPEPLPAEEASLAAEQADIEGPLVDWRAKGHTVELEGTDTLQGGDAYRLKVKLASGAVRHIWIDAKGALIVKTASTRTVRGRELEIETVYGDYQETSGVRFARSIETGVRGRPRRLHIVVESVEVNPSLPEDRFQMPR